jgi:hypothetical protein
MQLPLTSAQVVRKIRVYRTLTGLVTKKFRSLSTLCFVDKLLTRFDYSQLLNPFSRASKKPKDKKPETEICC